jgi:hypothetical protein
VQKDILKKGLKRAPTSSSIKSTQTTKARSRTWTSTAMPSTRRATISSSTTSVPQTSTAPRPSAACSSHTAMVSPA